MFLPLFVFVSLFVISLKVGVDDDDIGIDDDDIGVGVSEINDIGVVDLDDIGIDDDDIGVGVAEINDISVVDLDVGVSAGESGWLIMGSALFPNQGCRWGWYESLEVRALQNTQHATSYLK